MKVAICFYGQPRRYKEILNDWKNVIDELSADVFIHTWSGVDRIGNYIDINSIIDDYNPKEIQVSTLHKFLQLIPEKYAYQNHSYHVMQRTYSSTVSFAIMNEYTKNFNKKYDIVIETRMDVKIRDFIKFINFIKSIKENDDSLYVCSNHRQGHVEFDDAIMVGKYEIISPLWMNAFSNTIEFINKTSVIPGNEFNITRYVIESNIYGKIKRTTNMDYDLLSLESDKSLINVHQNI